jgi:hypothetical protein
MSCGDSLNASRIWMRANDTVLSLESVKKDTNNWKSFSETGFFDMAKDYHIGSIEPYFVAMPTSDTF